jgi:hypothetical protein
MTIPIEQAIYGDQDAGGYQFLARSPGFLDDWLPEAQRLCAAFGERPVGVTCPACIFAQPFGKHHVAIVQVADQGRDDTGRPGALGFHLLVLPRSAYTNLGGDPYFIADRFPPPWNARGELPVVSLPSESPPPRTVKQVQQVLQREDGPNLLGGAQALVDGGRLVFERPAPDTQLLRDLWTLLPTSTRCQVWPASFAFANTLGFNALVTPRAPHEDYADYLTEEQAGHYPEGHYELHLQIAAEAGDQRELDILFARRSRRETWQMGLILLGALMLLLLVGGLLSPPPAPPPEPAPKAASEPVERLDLPPPEQYPTLSSQERRQLTKALYDFAKQLGVKPLSTWYSANTLLSAIAKRLGPPETKRNPGKHLTTGPTQRRLRVLLWQHGVAGYNDPKLNNVELVERLQQHVNARKAREKEPRD